MKKWMVAVLPLFLHSICGSGCGSVSALVSGGESAVAVRSFQFEYAVKLSDIPREGKELRIWIPLPASDENQEIRFLDVLSPVKHRITEERQNGNRMAYLELSSGANPLPETIPIIVKFSVLRKEAGGRASGPADIERYLQPDSMAPFIEEVKIRAAMATSGKVGANDEARAIYENVLAKVDYGKSGDGWGRGDLQYVCDVGKGNCSDFHTLFTTMARVSGVPAYIEIGFPLPQDSESGEIGGYHCWAWYYDGSLWNPVDASEADKDPAREEYFFGKICENRVALTRGRDIVLEPRQAGDPLNFFIYPYIELDGVVDHRIKTEKRFLFKGI